MHSALLRTGSRDLQLTVIEKGLLRELRDFLKPFRDLTNAVSGTIAHVGYVTLIRHEIQTICKSVPGESWEMKELKRLVLVNHDRPLPQNDITTLATLLDPGTKQAIDLPREERASLTCLCSF